MKIDYYNSNFHKGTQPIRVLYQNVKYWFENVYPTFKTTELNEAIEKFGLVNEINVIDREDKIASPAFVGTFKIISIQESFQSYLWCITYALLYLYDKTIHEPRINKTFIIDTEAKKHAKIAEELFRYGLSLLDRYNPWDKENLPNPEYYNPADEEYVEKTNGAYLHAVNFILIHELGHVLLGHIDSDIESDENGIQVSNEIKLKDEIEADDFSFERMFLSTSQLTNDHTASVGVITALCSFVFFNASMNGGDHPDPDKRLQTALERLKLDDADNLWGLAVWPFLYGRKHIKLICFGLIMSKLTKSYSF